MYLDNITQKIAIHLPEHQSLFIIQIANLSHICGCDLEQNQTVVIMSGKRPHFSWYSYDFIRIQSLMIYFDILEYIEVGET